MAQGIKITREPLYGGPLARRRYQYLARLSGEVLAHADTREEAAAMGYQTLLEAYRYVCSTCEARTAHDGTVIIVRQTGDGIGQVEYNRSGRSSGICTGRMTNGLETFKSTREYADYLIGQYDRVESAS